MTVILNLGSPDILGLQLPEAFTSTVSGEGFQKLQSKNVMVENHGITRIKSLDQFV